VDPIPLGNIRDRLADDSSQFSAKFKSSLARILLIQLRKFEEMKDQLDNEEERFLRDFHIATGVPWDKASDVQKDRYTENHALLVAKKRAVDSVVEDIRTINPPDQKRPPKSGMSLRKGDVFDRVAEERRNSLADILERMDNLTGLDNIKNAIAGIVVQYVYEPESVGQDHLNIALGGPPGTGKTTVALLIMQIFYNLGVLPKPVAPDALAKSSGGDLISGFEGGTPGKTSQFMTRLIGSVGFLDEAYSLAAGDSQRLSYGRMAIDTIVSMLDAYVGMVCLIVAGYARELETSFFSANIGMPRRFPWRWETAEFSHEQLWCILTDMLADRKAMFNTECCTAAKSLIKRAHELGVFRTSNAGGIKTIVERSITAYTIMQYHGDVTGKHETQRDSDENKIITPLMFRHAMNSYIQSMFHKQPVFYDTDRDAARRKNKCEGCTPIVGETEDKKKEREQRCEGCDLTKKPGGCEPCTRGRGTRR